MLACALALVLSGSAAAKTSNDFAGHHRQVFRVVVVPRADARRPAAARDRRRGRPDGAERRAAHEPGRRVRGNGARDPLQHAAAEAARRRADPRPAVERDSGARAGDRRRPAARDVGAERPPLPDRRDRPRLPRPAHVEPDARARPRLDRRRRAHRAADAARARRGSATAAPSRRRTGSRIADRGRAQHDDAGLGARARRCSSSSRSSSRAARRRRSAPRSPSNLVLGWFPTGDAAPRVDARSALCTVAGGIARADVLPAARRGSALALVALLVAYAVSMLVQPVDALARADRARS